MGTYPANAFGLHNMLGNVREWTEDCWIGSYWEASRDGSAATRGECTRRALRGGSHYDSPRHLRSAKRGGEHISFKVDYVGFRVARTIN